MKIKSLFALISAFSFFLVCVPVVQAAPEGDIIIYNASGHNVTAQVSSFGKFTLGANERRNVSYNMLQQACGTNPTNCQAQFYVNDVPAGYAAINVVTGKLLKVKVSAIKVHTGKGTKNILRTVVIK